MHQTLSLLMEQTRSSLYLPNKEASAFKRYHILLSSHQQTSAHFSTVSSILFSLYRMIHLAAYMKTPQNTKNWILIVGIFLMLFSFALIKLIFSLTLTLNKVRTFYVLPFIFRAFENTLDDNGSYLQNVLSLFVTETLYKLELL